MHVTNKGLSHTDCDAYPREAALNALAHRD
jgi:hypothetical protein